MKPSKRYWLRGVLRWHGPLLVVGWLLNNLHWMRTFGVPYLVADSRARYLPYAHDIAERGYFAPGHDLRYVGYPLWLSGWLKIGAGSAGAAWGQWAVAGAAAAAFYYALYRLTRRRAVAIFGTAALVLWPDTQEFNGFILTESLVSSGLLLSLAAVVRAHTARAPAAAWAVAFGAALLTATLRPNAFVLVLAVGVAGLVALRAQYGRLPAKKTVAIVALALLPLGWVGANKLLQTFTLVETYARGEVIYGTQVLALDVPPTLWLPPAEAAPVVRLLTFAGHNPAYFFRLMTRKIGLFFMYARPYHSGSHAALIVLFIWPLYGLAVRGARNGAVWRPARMFLVTVVVGQALIVGLTVEDWDGRFLIAILPAVFALAALATHRRRRLPAIASPPPAPPAVAP